MAIIREIVLEFCYAVEVDLFQKMVCLGDEVSKVSLKFTFQYLLLALKITFNYFPIPHFYDLFLCKWKNS